MFLKNRNIISKMKISKVTDYAALNRSHQGLQRPSMSSRLFAHIKARQLCLFSLLEVKNRLYFGICLATLCLIRVDNHCNSGEQICLSLAWLLSLHAFSKL